MKDQKKAEAVASERMQLLAPLLAEGLDTARASQIKRQICEQTGLSERTLRRYLAKYRQGRLRGSEAQRQRTSAIGSDSAGGVGAGHSASPGGA
jgi:hypothetical protein